MKHTHRVLLFFTLFCIALNTYNCIALRTIYPAYLIWNLFLAYLPYLFTDYFEKSINHNRPAWIQLFLFFAWLFFFPNTIYMVTDFIHLYDQIILPVWFDIVQIFSFTWIACLLGFLSLYKIEQIITRKFYPAAGRILVITVGILSSIGIYIGRELRWNSWDIFIQPWNIFIDLIHTIAHISTALPVLGMIILFSGLFFGVYFSLRALAQHTNNQ